MTDTYAAQTLLTESPGRCPALIDRHIGRSHHLGLTLSLLCYPHPRGAFALGVRNPFATRAFVDQLTNRAGYTQVIARLCGTLPLFGLMGVGTALAGVPAHPPRRQRE
jgi:hypothetical protein